MRTDTFRISDLRGSSNIYFEIKTGWVMGPLMSRAIILSNVWDIVPPKFVNLWRILILFVTGVTSIITKYGFYKI